MLNFRYFSIAIQVEGKDLPEYQTEYHDGTKTATCWIPSEAGQRFTIRCEQERSFNYTTSAGIYLDGSEKAVTRVLMGKGGNFSGRVKTVKTSSTTRCPLQFASLESTDDDKYLDSGPDFKAPGTIRVQIRRARVTGQKDWEARALPVNRLVVHEKSKKAGGHVTRHVKALNYQCVLASLVRLGDPESCRVKRIHMAKPLTPADRDPWVTFEFRYRSAATLQAEGIMPKATRRENEEIDERSEGGKAALKAELLDIDAAQASLDARAARVRAQHGPISLKRDTSPICVPRNVIGKTFDLTSDD